MRTKGKIATWTVALTAVAAFVAAGTVYASSTAKSAAAPVTKTLDSSQLRDLLVPAAEQPAGSDIKDAITLKEAQTSGLLATPGNLVFQPNACTSYLQNAIGDLGALDGWMQYGSRPHDATSKKYADGLFVTVVANIPGGANISKIRAAAAACKTGTLTLNQRVTGTVTFTENHNFALANADTFSMTQGVYFAKAADAASKAVLAENGYLEEATCDSLEAYVGVGDLLIWTLEPNAADSAQITTAVHSKAVAALGLS